MSTQQTLFSFFSSPSKQQSGNKLKNQVKKTNSPLSINKERAIISSTPIKNVTSTTFSSPYSTPVSNKRNMESMVVSQGTQSSTQSTVASSPCVTPGYKGKHIQVYKSDRNQWLDGLVTRQDGNYCSILYDDGDVDKLDLTLSQYKIMDIEPNSMEIDPMLKGLSQFSPIKQSTNASTDSFNASMNTTIQEDDEEEIQKIHKPKRQRKQRIDDDDDYQPPSINPSSIQEDDEDEELSQLVLDEEIPIPSKRKSPTKSYQRSSSSIGSPTKSSPRSTSSIGSPIKSINASIENETDSSIQDIELNTDILNKKQNIVLPVGAHVHNSLDFLKNVRDAQKRSPSHPSYDPSTLYVPPSYINSCTPALRIWWEFKCQYYDCVLFYKMGKFYEFYHMDADIIIKELGLIYMKGEIAHCGFPEGAYSMYAQKMVEKGYRIARVEQTETPEQLKERNQNTKGKKSTTVRREVCSILSPGVSGHGTIDKTYNERTSRILCAITEYHENQNGEFIPSGYHEQIKLMEESVMMEDDTCDSEVNTSLNGVKMNKSQLNNIKIGITVSDTARGSVFIDEFIDDDQYTLLRTILLRYMPTEILLCYPLYSLNLKTAIHVECPSCSLSLVPYLYSQIENDCAIQYMYNHCIFTEYNENLPINNANKNENIDVEPTAEMKQTQSWPEVLNQIYDMTKQPYATLPSHQAISMSLSLFVMYLVRCRCANIICSQQRFSTIHQNNSSSLLKPVESFGQFMELDSDALRNLEIFSNNNDNTEEGSLFEFMNHTVTPFGKRLLREWISKPLFSIEDMNERYDAIDYMIQNPSFSSTLISLLKQLPDMERSLSRIHDYGSVFLNRMSAEGRAVFFDQLKYNKRKIHDFLELLEGYHKIQSTFESIRQEQLSFTSSLLQAIFSLPSLEPLLTFFDNAFDHQKAEQDGIIIPSRGVVQELDEVDNELQQLNNELDDYLHQIQIQFHSTRIVYFGSNKDRFQLQFPDEVLKSTPLSNDYLLKSQRKGVKRYWTSFLKERVDQLLRLESKRTEILTDVMRSVFFKLYTNHSLLEQYTLSLSILDCLLSLVHISTNGDGRGEVSRPHPVHSETPFISLEHARHPCVLHTYSNDVYIDNDTYINTNNYGKCIIITGPNMGGKSTLLRQVCINIIIAQIGGFVPASKLEFTPVDRIFTRIGARDSLLSHQSTFYTELIQTHSLLTTSSKYSLAIIDELGRGTSTYDGAAIASAVLNYLVQPNCPLVLFSTHYNFIISKYIHNPFVTVGHMSCTVTKNQYGEDEVVFLYKFKIGNCEKSFGLNVARLANLPQQVISRAHIISDALQTNHAQQTSLATYKSIFNALSQQHSLSLIEKQKLIHNQLYS